MKEKRKLYTFLLLLGLLACLSLPARALGPGDLLLAGGQTVAIELDTEGVLVAGLAEVETGSGCVSPAREAGLLPGDRITAVNGAPVGDDEDFLRRVRESGGGALELLAERKGELLRFAVTPVRGADGELYLGLWLRGSISGIGTITFQDPVSGFYGALGHGVCSGEGSGSLTPIRGGIIGPASVARVVPGRPGSPGELVGLPRSGPLLGDVQENTRAGIFGSARPLGPGSSYPAAAAGEVCPGEAEILSTVAGAEPRRYRVEITHISRGSDEQRQLALLVTDESLLSITGGIVQGMSGSPIIQNGKLVGAVTHVLVNDPTRGYGILIENMLAAAG